MTVRLDTSELNNILRRLPGDTDRKTREAAAVVEGYAKGLAPVDTGALRNSIQTTKMGNAHYWVADGVEYGIYQELGTSKAAAQPFMVPAIEQAARQFEQVYKDLL